MSINICATLGANTGKGLCEVRMGLPKYFLFTRGKELTEDELADSETLEDTLQAAMLLANGVANKVYAFPVVRVVDDNTGDPNTQALADGYEEVLVEASLKYQLQSTPTVCVQQAMTNFNGWSDKVYVIDDQQIFWHVTKAAGGAKGFSVGYLYTNPPGFKNSGAINTAKTRITFGSLQEFKTSVGAVKIDFDVSALVNIVDVVLEDRSDDDISPGTTADNVFTLGGKLKCDGTDIYTSYSTLLASTARWTATRTDTGATIAISTVTADATLKGWVITLDSSAFTALPAGTKIKINLAAPDVLDAAGVTGIEGNSILMTKP